VPTAGLEPASLRDQLLGLACLPIPPRRQKVKRWCPLSESNRRAAAYKAAALPAELNGRRKMVDLLRLDLTSICLHSSASANGSDRLEKSWWAARESNLVCLEGRLVYGQLQSPVLLAAKQFGADDGTRTHGLDVGDVAFCLTELHPRIN
jgi:hypothetical protein